MSAIVGNSLSKKSKKKKSRKKQDSIRYQDYLADSGGSDYDTNFEDEVHDDEDNFFVGMDFNILIHQTIRNINQSVCLEGSGGSELFGDNEMIAFAAAAKNNKSIVSIQIKYIDVTDVSLIPLCEALENHPTLRAFDICGTKGSIGTSKALAKLALSNPNIIFIGIDDSFILPSDSATISEAVQYNAMVCPDPSTNPFQLGLLRKFSEIEQKEKNFIKRLEPQAWMMRGAAETGDSSNLQDHKIDDGAAVTNKKKKNAKNDAWSHAGRSSNLQIGGEVCSDFIRGGCPYGSRCKYYHPEFTSALSNAIQVSLFESGRGVGNDGTTTVMTTAFTEASRLQSRLRPSHFTLKLNKIKKIEEASNNSSGTVQSSKRKTNRRGSNHSTYPSMRTIYAIWMMTATVVTCSVAVILIN